MSVANPYASFLDGRPATTILADSPVALAALFASIGPECATVSPAPGKWSPAQILSHLADCEIAHGYRLRQTLAEENHAMQPFDQDLWAIGYETRSAAQALAVFTALRQWNLLLIDDALPHHADRAASHPERGPLTFRTLVETMAGHDLNHIAQLQRVVS